jgi:hypothetical protein
MFENVQFFSHLHLKYAKSAIMTQKMLFLKNIIMGIKKAGFRVWQYRAGTIYSPEKTRRWRVL